MSALASASTGSAEQRFRFFESTIGKKVIMAVSGFVLFGFVVGHMLGNLQIFMGPKKLDSYAHFLRDSTGLLWGARTVIGLSVLFHIWTATQLAMLNRKSRPTSYHRKKSVGSTYASRTMLMSGPILLVFLIYHLLHFTYGTAHPDFGESVYRNVVVGFQQIPVSLFYIFAMVLLHTHLYHGAWSMFQSLGINHPRYTPKLRTFAAVMATVLAVGNISIPVAVMLGWVQ